MLGSYIYIVHVAGDFSKYYATGGNIVPLSEPQIQRLKSGKRIMSKVYFIFSRQLLTKKCLNLVSRQGAQKIESSIEKRATGQM